MRIVVQRSKEASVTVNEKTVGEIDSGLVLLVGITHDDTEEDARYLADKIVNLRIFEDENGKMNVITSRCRRQYFFDLTIYFVRRLPKRKKT